MLLNDLTCTTIQRANNMILISQENISRKVLILQTDQENRKLQNYNTDAAIWFYFSSPTGKCVDFHCQWWRLNKLGMSLSEGQLRLRSLAKKSERKGWEGLDTCWGGIYWVKDDEYGEKKGREQRRFKDVEKGGHSEMIKFIITALSSHQFIPDLLIFHCHTWKKSVNNQI